MKTSIQRNTRSGSSLVTVMIVVVTMGALLATALSVSLQNSFSTQRQADRIRSIAIAEGGCNRAYGILANNWAARTNGTFPMTLTNYCGGTCDIYVRPVSTNIAVISSTGMAGRASASVVVDAMNYGPTPGATNIYPGTAQGEPTGNPFGYAILCGGGMTWVGNADFDIGTGAWIHANGDISANGTQVMNGNLASGGTIDFPVGAGYTNIPNDGQISIPEIAFEPYFAIAASNKMAITNASYNPTGSYCTPAGGVLWVQGDIEFDNGTYKGCFIATGDITFKTTGGGGLVVTTNNPNYPVLMAQSGFVEAKQTKDFSITGLTYIATQYFSKSGNGDAMIYGSIIAKGNVDKNGGWDGAMYRYIPTPMGYNPAGAGSSTTENGPDRIGISAWHK